MSHETQCETCGHIFASDQELREHLLSAHGREEDEEQIDILETEDEESAA